MMDFSNITEAFDRLYRSVEGLPFSAHYYEALWYLLIFGFLGWVTEVIFAAVRQKKFVNRGFLNGPVCPIYGFGTLALIAAAKPFQDLFVVWRILLIFFLSAVIATVLEYLTGLVLSRVFHKKWWDYTGIKGNLGGYVCLPFSLLWGAVGTAVVLFVYPLVRRLVALTASATAVVILTVLLGILLLDFLLTLLELAQINRKLTGIEEISRLLGVPADTIGEGLFHAVERVEERKEELGEKREEIVEKLAKYRSVLTSHSVIHQRLSKAFPNLGHEAKLKAVAHFKDLYRRIKINK